MYSKYIPRCFQLKDIFYKITFHSLSNKIENITDIRQMDAEIQQFS